MFNKNVYKAQLDNGLTILVLSRHQIPKVSLQLWYNVGSKDEKSGEKGIAHLIEHMIFKGTTSMSESDINTIVHKISGVTNAFTSHDYTGYLFDVPSQHWKIVLPIMADCMQNCTFKPELLNSELKAVIQELRMYHDDYASTLSERIVAQMFADHPYHYPVIGYKQDLWSLQRENLVDFYRRHYVPNNATLVVVGDVKPDEVMKEVKAHFAAIPADLNYQKSENYHSFDLQSHQVTMCRAIQQPINMVSFAIPGASAGLDYVFDLISWVIGSGKGSRLSALLVDELELVTEIECFVYDMFEHGCLFIYFQPKNYEDVPRIKEIIFTELRKLAEKEISDLELERAIRKTEVDYLSLAENNQKMAYLLGKYFLATGNEHYLTEYLLHPREGLKEQIKSLINEFLYKEVASEGEVLPLSNNLLAKWEQVQQQSDAEDERVLSGISRETAVEDPVHAHKIIVESPESFIFPKPEIFTLSNGLKVLAYHNPETPKIDCVLELKAKHYWDSVDKQGLMMLLYDVLNEGTKVHPNNSFAQVLESYGMELSTFPGTISLSMLSKDAQAGLSLLAEVLTQAGCDEQAVDRVRDQMLSELKVFWDTPAQFAGQLVRQELYKNHPYAKNMLGTAETLHHLTTIDVKDSYKKFISPHGARLAIVGDLSGLDVQNILETNLGQWKGPHVEELSYPALSIIEPEVINYQLSRDQIVLCFGGISVSRLNPDYDKLLLFDQIFGGGVLGSMSSRLFELREQSGLFYTIQGSLLAAATKQPGMALIKTIISPDRLHEAETVIKKVIDDGAAHLSVAELEESQRAIAHHLVDYCASNKSLASTFLFLDEYNLPMDYFDHRAKNLQRISVHEVKEAVAKVLDTTKMITVRVGRI